MHDEAGVACLKTCFIYLNQMLYIKIPVVLVFLTVYEAKLQVPKWQTAEN